VSRIVAISPHLGDAVFSCGATLARHAAQGHDVVLVSVFTHSGPEAEADDAALRRAEDERAAAILGLGGAVHLGLEDAPQRGYGSGLDLFDGLRPGDDAPKVASAMLAVALSKLAPDLVLAPIGLAGHVDHDVVAQALDELGLPRLRWVDLPYALRRTPGAPLGAGDTVIVAVAEHLEAKLDACASYGTRVAADFAGPGEMRTRLARYAEDEGARLGAGGPVEVLLAHAEAEPG
jgi:LmbE family N-acetylglucosaminyl deacetylase